MKDFVEFYGVSKYVARFSCACFRKLISKYLHLHRFGNVTNGSKYIVSPSRAGLYSNHMFSYAPPLARSSMLLPSRDQPHISFAHRLIQCNPQLSALITETLKIPKEDWLRDLYKLEGLLKFVDDKKFQQQWFSVKKAQKERLAHHIEVSYGIKLNTDAMFDVQIKVCNRHSECASDLSVPCDSVFMSIRYNILISPVLNTVEQAYMQRQTLNLLGVVHVRDRMHAVPNYSDFASFRGTLRSRQ